MLCKAEAAEVTIRPFFSGDTFSGQAIVIAPDDQELCAFTNTDGVLTNTLNFNECGGTTDTVDAVCNHFTDTYIYMYIICFL